MKILLLSPYVPVTSSGGGGTVYYHYINSLSQSNLVDLLCLSSKASTNLGELKAYCKNIKVFKLNLVSSIIYCFLNLFTKMPLRLSYANSKQMIQEIIKLNSVQKYDLIWASHERMAPYAQLFKHTPKILDLHDLVSLRHKQLLKIEKNPVKWIINFLESYRMKKFEMNIPNYFDIILLGNSWEANLLKNKIKINNIMVAPRSIQVESFNVPNTYTPNTLIFTGAMHYLPNEDACLFFSKKILPIITKSVPDIKFYVVGNRPSKSILNLSKNKNIIVTGFVPDMSEYLRQSAVFVCPLRVGTGVRMKILEAMAAGRPVISTTIGYKGIDATNMENIVIADTPDDFAKMTIRLLMDRNLYTKIAEGGKDLVRKKYDINRISTDINQIVQRAAS